jgi:predicted  nucleic acid-binding Zn-ribbon protein
MELQAECTHTQYRQFQNRLQSAKPNHTLIQDLHEEMKNLETIDDILEELTMIKRALSNQAHQVKQVFGALSGTKLAKYDSHPYLENIERLIEDAHRVRSCVR